MSLIAHLFKNKFNAVELMLLEKLQGALPPGCDDILRKQVGAIDHVNRMSEGREVLCYTSKSRRSPEVPRFAAMQAELKLARIRFSDTVARQAWTADFYAVKGYFFSIVFTPQPKWRNTKNLIVDDVKLYADPSKSLPDRAQESAPLSSVPDTIPEWVKSLLPDSSAYLFYKPLSRATRQRAVERISGVLPEDYSRLVESSEGLVIGNVSILGVSQVFEVVLPDWNYYVLAEVGSSGVLAVKAESESPEVYFLDYEGPAHSVGNSFSSAVRSMLNK